MQEGGYAHACCRWAACIQACTSQLQHLANRGQTLSLRLRRQQGKTEGSSIHVQTSAQPRRPLSSRMSSCSSSFFAEQPIISNSAAHFLQSSMKCAKEADFLHIPSYHNHRSLRSAKRQDESESRLTALCHWLEVK